MNDPAPRRSSRLALWIFLAVLATVWLAAYAREQSVQAESAYLVVRAQSARPLSARPSIQPGPTAFLFASRPDECATAACVVAALPAARYEHAPRAASIRHEYPRGPPAS